MSTADHGPLASYNSLIDTHLTGYFTNTRLRRHLYRAGLVTRNGEIVPENVIRLNVSKKEHKKHMKEAVAQSIVHKTLDLERKRQAEIRKTIEQMAKIQLVRRMKGSREHRGEEMLPYLNSGPEFRSSRATSGYGQSRSRPVSSPRWKGKKPLSELSSNYEDDDSEVVIYLDDEGRPLSPNPTELRPGKPHRQRSSDHREHSPRFKTDSKNLTSADTAALRKYAMLMARLEQGHPGLSPYLIPQIPIPPTFPRAGHKSYSARRYRPAHRESKSGSPKRPSTSLHPPATAKMFQGQPETLCQVSMQYLGRSNLFLAGELCDRRQEVLIEQQHCGGNTLVVYKDRLEPYSNFTFTSFRHRGFPFSLTIYIDGTMDCRVSTCCEFRHKQGVRIGGKTGHFSIKKITGAIPCYRCQVEKGIKVHNPAPRPKLKRPPQDFEEVVVASTKKPQSPKAETKKSPKEGSKPKDQVMVSVEKIKDTKKNDNYEDDFDSSSSSGRSSSGSGSRSQSRSSDSSNSQKVTKHGRKEETGKERGRGRAKRINGKQGTGRNLKTAQVTLSKTDRSKNREEIMDTSNLKSSPDPRGVSSETINARRAKVSSQGSVPPKKKSNKGNSTQKNREKSRGDNLDQSSLRNEKSQKYASKRDTSLDTKGKQQSSSSDPDKLKRDNFRDTEFSNGHADKPVVKDTMSEVKQSSNTNFTHKENLSQLQLTDTPDTGVPEDKPKKIKSASSSSSSSLSSSVSSSTSSLSQTSTQSEKEDKNVLARRASVSSEGSRKTSLDLKNSSRPEPANQDIGDHDDDDRVVVISDHHNDEKLKVVSDFYNDNRGEVTSDVGNKRLSNTRFQAVHDTIYVEVEDDQEADGLGESTHSKSIMLETASEQLEEGPKFEAALNSQPVPKPVPQTVPQPVPEPVPQSAARFLDIEETASIELFDNEHSNMNENMTDFETKNGEKEVEIVVIDESRQTRQRRSSDSSSGSNSASSSSSLSSSSSSSSSLGYADALAHEPSPIEDSPGDEIGAAVMAQDTKDDRHSTRDNARNFFVAREPTADKQLEEDDWTGEPTADKQIEKENVSLAFASLEIADKKEIEDKLQETDNNHQTVAFTDGGETDVIKGMASLGLKGAAYNEADNKLAEKKEGDNLREFTEEVDKGDNFLEFTDEVDGGDHELTSKSEHENRRSSKEELAVEEPEHQNRMIPKEALAEGEPPQKSDMLESSIMSLLDRSETSVELQNLPLGLTQLDELTAHLLTSPSVQCLSLVNCGLGQETLQMVVDALVESPSNPSIVDLSHNPLTGDSINILVRLLRKKPSVVSLNIQNTNLGDEGVRELFHEIMKLNKEQVSGPSGSGHVNKAHLELNISGCGCGNAGAKSLAELITFPNSQLKSVSLSHNPDIDYDGWRDLGQALADTRTLQDLCLSHNSLGNEGVMYVAAGLAKNKSVTAIDLRFVDFSERGGQSLLEMFKTNTTITKMDLEGNDVSQKTSSDIMKYMHLNDRDFFSA